MENIRCALTWSLQKYLLVQCEIGDFEKSESVKEISFGQNCLMNKRKVCQKYFKIN